MEQCQTNIARTVTGACKGTNHDLIYSNLKWETLSSRRENVKNLNMHKMINNNAPTYPCNSIPKEVEPKRYNLRNSKQKLNRDIQEKFHSIWYKLWNNLDQHEQMHD